MKIYLLHILLLLGIYDLSAQQTDFNHWYNSSLSNRYSSSAFNNRYTTTSDNSLQSAYNPLNNREFSFNNNYLNNNNNLFENKDIWFDASLNFAPFEDTPRQNRVGRDETPDDPSVTKPTTPTPLGNGVVELIILSLLWILKVTYKTQK